MASQLAVDIVVRGEVAVGRRGIVHTAVVTADPQSFFPVDIELLEVLVVQSPVGRVVGALESGRVGIKGIGEEALLGGGINGSVAFGKVVYLGVD